MRDDLKTVTEALTLIRAFGDDTSHSIADNALALVKAHSCSSAAEAWKRAYNDDVERMAKAAADAESSLVEAVEDRTLLRTALEDTIEMAQSWADGSGRTSPDHDRVARARAALKETEP